MIEETKIAVSDAMNTKPISVKPRMIVTDCAKLMREKDIGSVIIEENGVLLGFLTEQGIIHKVVARGKDPNKVTVREIMKNNILTVHPGMDIRQAVELMANRQIRQLPVLDKGKIVGLLTRNDVLKIQPALMELLVQKMNMHNEVQVPGEKIIEGYCESCGNYSYNLKRIKGKTICRNCRA